MAKHKPIIDQLSEAGIITDPATLDEIWNVLLTLQTQQGPNDIIYTSATVKFPARQTSHLDKSKLDRVPANFRRFQRLEKRIVRYRTPYSKRLLRMIGLGKKGPKSKRLPFYEYVSPNRAAAIYVERNRNKKSPDYGKIISRDPSRRYFVYFKHIEEVIDSMWFDADWTRLKGTPMELDVWKHFFAPTKEREDTTGIRVQAIEGVTALERHSKRVNVSINHTKDYLMDQIMSGAIL